MTTLSSRRFLSTPQRDASSTWRCIVDLLTRGAPTVARSELMSVAGVAACVIADKAPEASAIVVTCDGPRTRIYCLYDEDAIDGSEGNEEPFGYDPLSGDWRVSLPCKAEDLLWVRAALKRAGSRITARDEDETLGEEREQALGKPQASLVVNLKGFFEP